MLAEDGSIVSDAGTSYCEYDSLMVVEGVPY